LACPQAAPLSLVLILSVLAANVTVPVEEDWRADVLAVRASQRVAFEVQWSRQTPLPALTLLERRSDARGYAVRMVTSRWSPVVVLSDADLLAVWHVGRETAATIRGDLAARYQEEG
jgi:hypothetical protein